MNKDLAIYITTLIANDLKHKRDVSSAMCESIEQNLIENKFENVETIIRNFLNDNRTVSEIVKES